MGPRIETLSGVQREETSPDAFGVLILVAASPLAFGWGHEGHVVVALIAEHNMTPAALKRAKAILGGASLMEVASWADEYGQNHRETGPWHYINIPLADSKIDRARECPNGQCVIAQAKHFLSVLKDSSADRAKKAEALKFVVHFVGDLHQPLHDEDDGNQGGNARHVVFDGQPETLHWVWDASLLEHIDGNPEALAAELQQRITPHDRAAWAKGSIEDWVMEGHRSAQSVAYGDLGSDNPAVIGPEYERQADPVIETQLEKAGVRLAHLLNEALR